MIRTDMNPEAQTELERVLKLDPSAVTPAEAAFLKARSSYLTGEQKRIFASVLEEVEEPKAPKAPKTPKEPKAPKAPKTPKEPKAPKTK